MTPEPIQYKIQCRFCARYISGASALDAAEKIAEHDLTHATCGRCRVARVTVPDASLCDDCANDETRAAARAFPP